MEFVIIGNSAAGLSAAETLRKTDPDAGITIITDEPHHSYLRCLLKEILSGEKDLDGICYRDSRFYEKHNINLQKGIRVTAISPDEKTVQLHDGREIGYDGLLVATGSAPVPMGIENEAANGVFAFRNYAQAAAAAGAAETGSKAVVIGAGLVGLGVARALNRRGIEVTVVEKASQVLVNQLDEQSASLLEKEFSKEGIKFVFQAKPQAFVSDTKTNGLKAVVLDDGSETAADMAVASAGVRPCAQLVKQAGGRTDLGIEVDDFLQTSLPHVFAAGDCIQVKDAATGRATPSVLWPMAVEQGRVAACNLLGRSRPYPLSRIRMNAAHFGDLPLISAGMVTGYDECLSHEDPNNRMCRRFFIKEGCLAGYVLMGDVNGAGIYTELVKKKIPVDHLKDRLLKGDLSPAALFL